MVLKNCHLTKSKLIKWINFKLMEFGINDFKVYKIKCTRYTHIEYECGAAKLLIYFKENNDKTDFCSDNFLSFYSINELEYYINNGYRLILKPIDNWMQLNNLELTVTKN